MSLVLAALLAATPPISEITAPGPSGVLAGSLLDAGKGAPVVLIIPGSGPTDRNGNNPLGVTAGSYRLLAEALQKRGVTTVRVDKRGMFGSRTAVSDPNAVTIADYAADVRSWIGSIRQRTGAECVWVLGHSEGALVALAAAQRPDGICGVISASGPGRRLAEVMRAQLRANPANGPILDAALTAVDELESGRRVDAAALPAPLPMLFPAAVQGFIIDLFAQDPAKLAASLQVPLLVVQGETDLQTSVEDARVLVSAQPKAKLALLPGVNHLLKEAPADAAANMATYSDPVRPISPLAVEAIASFVER